MSILNTDRATEARRIMQGYTIEQLQAIPDAGYNLLSARAEAIEQLARDLLARLSHDYGDGEDCPAEVLALFERGEALLPIRP